MLIQNEFCKHYYLKKYYNVPAYVWVVLLRRRASCIEVVESRNWIAIYGKIIPTYKKVHNQQIAHIKNRKHS